MPCHTLPSWTLKSKILYCTLLQSYKFPLLYRPKCTLTENSFAVQPKGASKKERVEEKMSIVRSAAEKCKDCTRLAFLRNNGAGPQQGSLGSLMRMDRRCQLLVPRLCGKLQTVQNISRLAHLAHFDLELLGMMREAEIQVSLAAPCNCWG